MLTLRFTATHVSPYVAKSNIPFPFLIFLDLAEAFDKINYPLLLKTFHLASSKQKFFAPHSFLLIYFPVSPYFLNLLNLECPGLTPWMSLLLYYIHSFKMASLFFDFNITYTLTASTFLCTMKSFPTNSRLPRYNAQEGLCLIAAKLADLQDWLSPWLALVYLYKRIRSSSHGLLSRKSRFPHLQKS